MQAVRQTASRLYVIEVKGLVRLPPGTVLLELSKRGLNGALSPRSVVGATRIAGRHHAHCPASLMIAARHILHVRVRRSLPAIPPEAEGEFCLTQSYRSKIADHREKRGRAGRVTSPLRPPRPSHPGDAMAPAAPDSGPQASRSQRHCPSCQRGKQSGGDPRRHATSAPPKIAN